MSNRGVRFYLFLVAGLMILSTSMAQERAGEPPLSVSTDFAGASAEIVEIDANSQRIHIRPGGRAARGWVCWWALRVDHLQPGKQLTLDVSPSLENTRNKGQLTQQPLAAGWAMPSQASISLDGKNWKLSQPGARESAQVRYQIVPEGRSLWIAWGPLFTPRDTEQLVAEAIAKIPHARAFELARSRAGRPVMALHIAPPNPAKSSLPGVWIQARQHAWESGSSWVARGLVEWLSERSAASRWLTEHCEVVVTPIMDVDNVATGNGGKEEDPRDHNRDWDESPVFPEVAATQRQLASWAAEQRLDFFIDLHNPAPSDKRPFFFVGPPELLSDLGRGNRSLFLEIAGKHIRGPLAVEPTPRVTGPSYHPLWRQISGQWVNDHGNDHTLAICLETSWNTPHSTTEGYRTVGQQLGEAISEYLQRRKR